MFSSQARYLRFSEIPAELANVQNHKNTKEQTHGSYMATQFRIIYGHGVNHGLGCLTSVI